MISKRNFIKISLIIIAIFLSYSYLQPLGADSDPDVSEANEFTLKTHGIGGDNKWATFRDDNNGLYFIHPGVLKPSVGIFSFKNSRKVILDFSIKEGSDVGEIEFTVKNNDKIIDVFVVTTEQSSHVSLDVKKGDTVEISADKYGVITSDWGELRLTVKSQSFDIENILIPFLWALLFIYMIGKNHLYIAVNSYIVFVLVLFAEKLNFGVLMFNDVLTYMLLIFSLTFLFTYLYQGLTAVKKYRVASLLSFLVTFFIYTIPLFLIIYALNFDSKVTKDILYAVFQTSSNESYEYVTSFVSTKYIFLYFFITGIVGWLLYKQEKKETLKIEKSLLIFISITFFSVSSLQFMQLRLPSFVVDGYSKYSEELRLFKRVQSNRKAGKVEFNATKDALGETYLVIIGESLNKKHMGIYGYLRDTTPLLTKMNDEGELIVFNNVYSNHTHTVQVMEMSLTEANQYNNKTYYNSLSIIDVLSKADVETYWLTNQTIYGAWDNMVSVIASSADNLIPLNKSIGLQVNTQKYDGALIPEIKKILSIKTDKNRVVFVHLMGNHFYYASRYPDQDFSIYKGALRKGEYGEKASTNTKINFYDNSVVYNDYVVSEILKMFQEGKGVKGALYLSDHADDVIGNLGHSSDKFTFEMTQIPMLAWFSDEYKNKYKQKYDNLLSNASSLYSNDMLYDTMIGIFGIVTDKYGSRYDYSSIDYGLEGMKPLVLHASRNYTDASNYIYWQDVNAKYLVNTNQSNRVFPHRVNSIGKLKDIWNDGFRSFEVDVLFGNNNNLTFQVGHNHGLMGVGLEVFLSKIDFQNIQKVWLDFKNLNENNYKAALSRLNYLNDKFGVKSKFIVESGTTGEFFKEFRKDGWQTSYYLPTNKIVHLLNEKDNKEMRDFSNRLAEQIDLQNLAAVSFDDRLYPFVKKYLEPKISDTIVYHIWYAPALARPDFKDELLKNKKFLDDRVKTLLTGYISPFNL